MTEHSGKWPQWTLLPSKCQAHIPRCHVLVSRNTWRPPQESAKTTYPLRLHHILFRL